MITALDPQGVVCGATIVTGDGRFGYLACYGDDPDTPVDEGARPGDTITLQANVDGQAQVIGMGRWTERGDRQPTQRSALPPRPAETPAPPSAELPAETPNHTWLPLLLNWGQD